MSETRRILVPVNGSASDEEAVLLACEHAARNRAEVIAIYVIEVKRTMPLDVDLPPESARGEDVLAKAEALGHRASVTVQAELLQARDVGTAIVDEAVERAADLIVMGVGYKRKFGEYDLGRTATYVLKNAPSRVWLARGKIASEGSRNALGAAAGVRPA